MLKIVLPVDGSPSAVRATQPLIDTLGWYKEAPSLDVVAVHLPRAERAQHGIVRQQGDDPKVLRRRMRGDARPQAEACSRQLTCPASSIC